MHIEKKTIHLREDEGDILTEALHRNPSLAYAHISHPAPLPQGQSLINAAWKKRGAARRNLLALTNAGFYVYFVRDSQTTLMVRHDAVPRIWPKVKSGELKISQDGIIYSITPPTVSSSRPNLLVIFSSMAANVFSPFLMRHFEQNFSTIQKYIPADTAVLRIADLGGVVGAFYLNTISLPNNEMHVQSLIAQVANDLHAKNVVLYGASKGGTASLYHSLLGGYRGISVDPILSDAYYVEKKNDSHFTEGTFPERKQEKFSRILRDKVKKFTNISVVYSDRSPQIHYIRPLLLRMYNEAFAFFNGQNPQIKDHPDVAKNTLHTAVMLINMGLLGMPIAATHVDVL